MSLEGDLRTDNVTRLRLRDPITATPDETISDAILKMRSQNLGCVIVVRDRKPVGLFTEAMLRTQLQQSRDIINDTLENQMAKTFPWVRTSDTIDTVVDAMEQKNVRFVAVVDDKGELVGLTGQKGLMEYVAEHFPREILTHDVIDTNVTPRREGA